MMQRGSYEAVPMRDVRSVLPVLPLRRDSFRHVVIATADTSLREALARELRLLRWSVREARGAAEIFLLVEQELPSIVMMDTWLPDLEVRECLEQLQAQYAGLELLFLDGSQGGKPGNTSPFRGELMHALREANRWVEGRSIPSEATPELPSRTAAASSDRDSEKVTQPVGLQDERVSPGLVASDCGAVQIAGAETVQLSSHREDQQSPRTDRQQKVRAELLPGTHLEPLPEFVGQDARLLEVSRRIRLVAHRKTAVLIQGPSGTGKELVARALHRLSSRPAERFIPINCAAIPETLVEAELFGCSKGAFTGAVQSRTGLLEAANGGTVFLDEIGELPPAIQSKLLRFLESGEIQRVGENRPVQLDVRVVAATHRKLAAMAAEGIFRLDLLQRLSVFLIQTPPLAGRAADIDILIDHCLEELGRDEPGKRLSSPARARLQAHSWPGNVRELQHALERAWILAGSDPIIHETCIELEQELH